MVEVVYDDALIREAVERENARRMDRGDLSLQKELIRVYFVSAVARPEAFQAAFRRLFAKFPCIRTLDSVLAGFPDIARSVNRVVVQRTADEEFGDLVDRAGEQVVVLELRVDTIFDECRLTSVARFQLEHVRDLLDPAFRFSRSPLRNNLVRDRYRLFWDIRIDARLGGARRQEYGRRLAALYGSLDPRRCDRILQFLYAARDLDHPRLLELAGSVRNLVAAAGISEPTNPLPGSPCPLCGFPTFDWAPVADWSLARAINGDYPNWTPAHGACGRCLERYETWMLRGATF